MTSQSPRIYTYKITFEEVPYYYYGVHKEKKFNENYWGTPVTNKWCWEFYTPKKQILELFEYSDEGWIEAQEIEKQLIKPFFNTDKWCLNENVGGIISLKICRETGKIHGKKNGKLGGIKTKELGVGLFSMSKEERTKASKRGVETNIKNKTGVFGFTFEERSEAGKKGWDKSKERGVAIFALTKEELSNQGKKTNAQKWMCLETGFIANPGNLSKYQKKRSICTSKRKRVA